MPDKKLFGTATVGTKGQIVSVDEFGNILVQKV
jgi:hypothetical protein